MSVAQKVKQIIVEQLGVDEAQVDETASFVDDLGADSLDIVELVMAFEEGFDIDIPDEDAEKITTVKDAVAYIENKAGKKPCLSRQRRSRVTRWPAGGSTRSGKPPHSPPASASTATVPAAPLSPFAALA